MAGFTLTDEQTEIIRFVREETGNLGVIARAGAGKTSTLVEMANAMSESKALSLAFNKAIAEEMRERLPANCDSSTLNSLGHRTWGCTIDTKLHLDAKKVSRIVRGHYQATA